MYIILKNKLKTENSVYIASLEKQIYTYRMKPTFPVISSPGVYSLGTCSPDKSALFTRSDASLIVTFVVIMQNSLSRLQ